MTDWTADAACRDAPTDDVERGFDTDANQKLFVADYCARCPVVADCGEHAELNNEREGVWGGQTELQRRRHRRHRTA